MISIFLFSLILGGGLLALSLLGDLVGGGDAGLDADLDAELDAEPAPSPAGGMEGDVALDAFRLFTIRNLTYFLFGFGAIGWLLTRIRPDLSLWVVTPVAILGGGLAAGIAVVVFGWVRATDSGWQAEEATFVGCEGRVVLPVAHGKTGLIMVRRGEREHELRALPFETGAREPERWRQVVVVDMDGGTARVSPMEALTPVTDGPGAT